MPSSAKVAHFAEAPRNLRYILNDVGATVPKSDLGQSAVNRGNLAKTKLMRDKLATPEQRCYCHEGTRASKRIRAHILVWVHSSRSNPHMLYNIGRTKTPS